MNAERTLMVLIGFHLLSRNFVPDTKTFILMKFNFVNTARQVILLLSD